jgi:hypothetical protein
VFIWSVPVSYFLSCLELSESSIIEKETYCHMYFEIVLKYSLCVCVLTSDPSLVRRLLCFSTVHPGLILISMKYIYHFVV